MKDRKAIPPGWYNDIANDAYHASEGLSSSNIKTLVNKTPRHLQFALESDEERTPTAQMILGSLVHSMILESETVEHYYTVAPPFNKRTKAGREEFEQWSEANKDKTIVTVEQMEQATAMRDSALSDRNIEILLRGAICETSVFWKQKVGEDELLCKVRPDAICRDHPILIDIKTGADVSYSAFGRSVHNFGYHLSAAMYLDGANQCPELLQATGHKRIENFLFVCIESVEPYLPAIYELSPEYLEIGRRQYEQGLRIAAEAMRSESDWPGYPDEIRILEPPSFARYGSIV